MTFRKVYKYQEYLLMIDSSQGLTYATKIGNIENAVIQHQSYIDNILQMLQSFLTSSINNQSNESLISKLEELNRNFKNKQINFSLNTVKDGDFFDIFEKNSLIINDHHNQIRNINSELQAVKYLLNNMKKDSASDNDFDVYQKKILEIENQRTKDQITPILTSIESIKREIKEIKESSNISNIEKVSDDLNQKITSLREEASPLLNEETRKFPSKLKEFKRELKQLKKIQEGIEKANSDLFERQERIFKKLRKLSDEKISPLEPKFDGIGLKGKIDEIPEQLNFLDLQDKISSLATNNDSNELKTIKDKICQLETENNRQNQSINQLLNTSINIDNSVYDNLESRVQLIEKRLLNFDQIELRNEFNEIKKQFLNIKTNKVAKDKMGTVKERSIGLTNDNKIELRLNKIENDIQKLNTLQNNSEIKALKNEISLIKSKKSQEALDTNAKIDTINSEFTQKFNELIEKIQSSEKSMLFQIKENQKINNANSQVKKLENPQKEATVWPMVQVHSSKHEVNPVIALLKEKIHDLVSEMNQAPDRSYDARMKKLKIPIKDAQENLKKLQNTLNSLIRQDSYETVKLTPQIIWDSINKLTERVIVLEEA